MKRRLTLEGIFQAKARLILIIAAGAFLLSALITMIVLLSTRPRREEPLQIVQPQPIGVQDFLLDVGRREIARGPYLFRERTPRWSEEQVRRFWVPMDEIILDILRRENDRNIEEFFEGIP